MDNTIRVESETSGSDPDAAIASDQARSSPQMPVFEVPPFARRCLEAASGIWSESATHPFVRALIDGSLDPALFRFYQMQDARYLEAYADVCSIISTRVPDPARKLWFIDGARLAILVERSLHENYGQSLGYTAEDIAALELTPDNRAYQNHMVAAAERGSLLEAICALAPCPWLYAAIGRQIALEHGEPPADHPYGDWIREYTSPLFVTYTNELLAHMQFAADGCADEEVKRRAVEMFVLSVRYEDRFWDQAWNQQTWDLARHPESEAS